MSEPDDFSPRERASAAFVVELLRDLPRALPTTEHIRVCERIEPDTRQWESVSQISDRYAVLTEKLPLAGAAALKPTPSGDLAITAHLRAQMPWMAPAIDILDLQLRAALWSGRPWVRFKPMLLVGPPGSGKSHFARLVADFAGTGHAVLSMGGMYESSLIIGAPRSYLSPSPCFPATVIAQTRTANPVIVGDEIDKVASDNRLGHLHAALLTLIEPSTAARFYDKCLLAECDVSHANWIFTANTLQNLSAPLRSRLDIVEVEGPGEAHFDQLLSNLCHDLARRWRVPVTDLPDLTDGAVDLLRARFARSRSVRRLQRELQAALSAGLSLTSRTLN